MPNLQRGCNLLRNIDVVHVEDISYIRYTFSGLCRKLLVGPENRLELGFLGDRYFLDSKMKAPDLQKVHKALLECCLGRKPSKPLQKWEGKVKGSWLKIRPEYVFSPALQSLLRDNHRFTILPEDVREYNCAVDALQVHDGQDGHDAVCWARSGDRSYHDQDFRNRVFAGHPAILARGTHSRYSRYRAL